jgi:hypothetical protein
VWGIRYEEIISLNTWEIQKLKAEIAALKKLIPTTTKQSKKEKKQ